MRNKTAKEKLLAIAVAAAAAVAMIPAGFMLSAHDADAASTITLNGKKFEYKDEYGKWHTNTRFSGNGYEGLCAKAHYSAYTGMHSYTVHDSSYYCRDNIMAKLAYYYGYVKGWTSGTNGARLARCLSYVSTQSGAKDKGKAFNFKKKTLNEMVSTAKNKKVPEGFKCWFVIPNGDASRQAAVIWKYTPPGSGELIKSSSVKGYKKSFAGCQYTVYKSNKKTSVGKLTCKSDGRTNVISLQPGTYYVKETKANANYIRNTGWITLRITSGKRTTIRTSDGAEGGFSLKKSFTSGSDSGYTLKGFRFELVSTADSKRKYTGTTDANGRISIKGLKAGTYRVTEKLTPKQQDEGYGNESKQGVKVTINNGKTASITWKNSFTKPTQLMIVKTTEDGSPVSGFRFDVRGYIKGRKLTKDTFFSYANIKTVKTKEGFTLGAFCVNEEELAELNSAAENTETGDCTVHVTAEAVKPGQPPQSKELDAFMTEEDSYVFAEGDALNLNGAVYIAQTAGTYSRDQILGTGDEECLLDEETLFRMYEAEDVTETITVPVKVELRSVREKDNVPNPTIPAEISQPEGWTVEYNNIIWAGSAYIYHKNDFDTVTKENGLIKLRDLPPGEYTVTEELTEKQQKRFRTPAPQQLTLKEGDNPEPIIFRFENETKATPVALMKTNAAKNGGVEGFEFTLTGVRAFDGTEIEPVTAITEEDGRIDFGELDAGDYVAEETGFDPSAYMFHDQYRLEGYECPAKAFTVTGEETEPIQLEFENDPITNLFITKVDRDTRMFLGGASFDLYEDEKKITSFRIIRDGNGRTKAEITWNAGDSHIFTDGGETADEADNNYAVLRGLKRNAQYRIVETQAPAGYAAAVDYMFTFEEDMEPIILENAAPQIETTAGESATGLHMANANGGRVTLVDKVEYRNLEPGKNYTLTGRLVFKDKTHEAAGASDEDAVPVKADGKEVESTVSFTPEGKDGSVDVSFTFDASDIEGAETVVFESLSDPLLEDGNTVIATHSEIDNENQSIYFPALRTTAKSEDTGMHITGANEETVIIDTVEYSNVIAGRIYEVSGVLMNQETGEAVMEDGRPVTAQVRFKATEDGPVFEEDEEPAEDTDGEAKLVSGSVDLRFPFDAREYAGKGVVVFEELFTNGDLIGQHKDLEDKRQTVDIPAVSTKASADRHSIKDEVSYSRLIPGQTYVMRGVMMDRRTGEPALVDGRQLRSELEFCPSEPDGEVTLRFGTDISKLRGRTLVAFETCYVRTKAGGNEDEIEIARHRRLDAGSQTVTFRTPQTGQSVPWALPAALVSALTAIGLMMRRKITGR